MVLCGTKNGFSMASLEEPFEAPLFLRVCVILSAWAIRTHTWTAWTRLLVFILPKACADGPHRGRGPYMCSRSASTVNKREQTIAQSYCTSGCLYIVLSTNFTCSGSNGRLHTACACAVGAFVAYCHKKWEVCGCPILPMKECVKRLWNTFKKQRSSMSNCKGFANLIIYSA